MATSAIAEEVAENLEEVAEVARRIDSRAVGIFSGGIVVGIAVGFYLGYKFNKEKLRAEAFRQSEEEIEIIREHYRRKVVAAQEKPDAEKIIEEKGYVSTPLVAVPDVRPLKPPVPVSEPKALQVEDPQPVLVTVDWNYPRELANRTPNAPYVIHRDEFHNSEFDYEQVTYTYYAGDDVLTGEDDKPVSHAGAVVGLENLKWGYGSGDENVVYIRNDKLELEIEVTRSLGSYEHEVMGLDDTPAN